jgi:thioredoxin-related protein
MKSVNKLETITNIAIIFAAILLCGLLVQKIFFKSELQSQTAELVKGTQLSIPDLDWHKNRKTLVLVLQKDCKFCTESMPFYKNLVERSKEKGVQVVAVLPDSRDEGIQYLKENGVDNIREIKQVLPKTINVRGTPTLILTDDKGEVLELWMGKLSSEKENEVMENL